MMPRHLNREFRTRFGIAPPRRTIAALVGRDRSGDARAGGPSRRGERVLATRADGTEILLIGLAGAALMIGLAIDSPLISVLTLPAALLAPGQLVLRLAATRLIADLDPWLLWPLRLVASLAVWTVLGAVLAIVPFTDPRWLGGVLGAGLVLAALALRARARHVPEPLEPTTALRPRRRPRWDPARGPRIRRAVIVFGVFALVAAGSLAIGRQFATQAAVAAPYVAIETEQPTSAAYDGSGRLQLTALVRNQTTTSLAFTVEAAVDGESLVEHQVRLPAGSSYRLPLSQLPPIACWTRLTVTLTGLPADLAPRPLVAWGPATSPGGCAAGG